MAKKKTVLKIKGDLIWDGNKMMPKPGVANFQITGAEDSQGKILLDRLLSIRIDKLSQPVTARHLEGEIEINIYTKELDKSEYEKNIEDKRDLANRRKS